MQNKQMYADISQLIAECVVISVDSIKPTSRLIDELGLDSLDFLDVVFSIEKKFGIKFRDGQFEKLLRVDLLLENNDPEGYINQQDMTVLKPYLPLLNSDPSIDIAKISAKDLFSMITVESLMIAVEELVEAREKSAALV
jgi:acyl carrier protein